MVSAFSSRLGPKSIEIATGTCYDKAGYTSVLLVTFYRTFPILHYSRGQFSQIG